MIVLYVSPAFQRKWRRKWDYLVNKIEMIAAKNLAEAEINSTQTFYGRATMGIQASRKWNNGICCRKWTRKCFEVWVQFVGELDWWNIGPKCEMANFAILKIVVLMCYFRIAAIVFVVAFRLRKLFYEMIICMNWLQQYWEQYGYCQRKTD